MPINQQKVVPGQGGLGGNNHGPVPNGKFDMNNGGLISTDCVGAKNGIFFGVFPMFVPSLSWQIDRFYTYMAPKCGCRRLLVVLPELDLRGEEEDLPAARRLSAGLPLVRIYRRAGKRISQRFFAPFR
jgi:hypothetical protein